MGIPAKHIYITHYIMRKLLLLLCLGFMLTPLSSALAQDLVITHTGDSINCKIISASRDTLYFYSDPQNKLQSTMPMEAVSKYQMNYFNIAKPETIQDEYLPSRFNLTLGGGYAFRLGTIPENLDQDELSHVRQLRHAHNYGAKAAVYFGSSRISGVGITFSRTTAIAHSNNLLIDNIILLEAEECISSTFIGVFAMRRWASPKHTLELQYGLGPLFYTDELSGSAYMYMKSTTFAVFAEFNYTYRLCKHISIGPKFSMISGQIKYLEVTGVQQRNNNTKYTRITLEENERQSAAHIELGAVLRFDF